MDGKEGFKGPELREEQAEEEKEFVSMCFIA